MRFWVSGSTNAWPATRLSRVALPLRLHFYVPIADLICREEKAMFTFSKICAALALVAVAAFLTIPTFAVKADNAPVAVCCCGIDCKCVDCSCIDGACTSCNCPACSCAACGCGEDCGSGTSLDAIKAKDCCKEKADAAPATGADGQAACCKS